MSEVIAALVGAVVAYVAGWLQQIIRQRRERKALASVLLQELRMVDMSMREMYERKQRGRLPEKPFPIIQGRRDVVRIFDTETVVKLLEVAGYLDNISDIQDSLQGGVLDPNSDQGPQILSTIHTIILRIPELKEALESEGGRVPDWNPAYAPVNLKNFGTLPPSPYDPKGKR